MACCVGFCTAINAFRCTMMCRRLWNFQRVSAASVSSPCRILLHITPPFIHPRTYLRAAYHTVRNVCRQHARIEVAARLQLRRECRHDTCERRGTIRREASSDQDIDADARGTLEVSSTRHVCSYPRLHLPSCNVAPRSRSRTTWD